MFKKSNKKNDEKSATTKTGDTVTTTTYQNSETGLFSSFIEERSMITRTSTSYSSVKLTNTNLGNSTAVTNTPNLNMSTSLFENHSSALKPFGGRLQTFDAKPSSSNGGYKSPFSRKLTPFDLDARPFSTTQPSSLLSQRSTSIQPRTANQNVPRYSSYLPENTNALNLASSTQSLPTSNSPIHHDPRIPTYNTQGKKRGKVVIINNIQFLQEKQERKGAEMDEKHLKTMFKDMGFEVETHRNLKRSAMVEKVDRLSADRSLKTVDISILIIMSHGSNMDDNGKVVQGGFTQIYGIDDKGLPIDEILDKFSAEKCHAMAGKPKIFIFQCCRGETEERTLRCDAAPFTKNVVKKHADMLIAFSTLPGFFSIRDTQQGSWYIQSICEVFKNHAKEFDVETLLKIVDQQLSKKHPTYQQTSTYECRGFKRCFLNPK